MKILLVIASLLNCLIFSAAASDTFSVTQGNGERVTLTQNQHQSVQITICEQSPVLLDFKLLMNSKKGDNFKSVIRTNPGVVEQTFTQDGSMMLISKLANVKNGTSSFIFSNLDHDHILVNVTTENCKKGRVYPKLVIFEASPEKIVSK